MRRPGFLGGTDYWFGELSFFGQPGCIVCKNGEEKLLHFNNWKIKSDSGEITHISSSASEVSYQFLSVNDL